MIQGRRGGPPCLAEGRVRYSVYACALRRRRRGSEVLLFDCHPARTQDPVATAVVSTDEEDVMKGSQKPKKSGKKPAQKTLKERRTEKRAAAKHGRSLDV